MSDLILVSHMSIRKNKLVTEGIYDTISDESLRTELANHNIPGIVSSKAINISNVMFSVYSSQYPVIEDIHRSVPWFCMFYIYRTKDYNCPCYQVILDLPGIWIQICDAYNANPIGEMENNYPGDSYNKIGVRINHNYYCIISEDVLPVNEWTHIYFDFDGESTHSLYINGKKINSNFNNPTNYNHAIAKSQLTIGYDTTLEIGYIDNLYVASGGTLTSSDFDLNNLEDLLKSLLNPNMKLNDLKRHVFHKYIYYFDSLYNNIIFNINNKDTKRYIVKNMISEYDTKRYISQDIYNNTDTLRKPGKTHNILYDIERNILNIDSFEYDSKRYTFRDIYNNNDTIREINGLNNVLYDTEREVICNILLCNKYDIKRKIKKNILQNTDTIKEINGLNNVLYDTKKNIIQDILYKCIVKRDINISILNNNNIIRKIKTILLYKINTIRNIKTIILYKIDTIYNIIELNNISCNTERKIVLGILTNNDTIRIYKKKIISNKNTKRKTLKNIKTIIPTNKYEVVDPKLKNDTERNVRGNKKQVFAFVTNNKYSLRDNNKTQYSLIISKINE